MPQMRPGDRLCSFHIFKNFAEKAKHLKSYPMAEKQYGQWTAPTGLRLGAPDAERETRILVPGDEKWSGEGKKINKGMLLWATETLRDWLCSLEP